MIAAQCDGFQKNSQAGRLGYPSAATKSDKASVEIARMLMFRSGGCTYNLDKVARIRQEGNFTTCILQDIPRCK